MWVRVKEGAGTQILATNQRKEPCPMKLQTVVEVELPEDFGSFQESETKIRDAVFMSGRHLMNQLMEMYESAILARKQFWKKDLKEKRFQTLIGEVKRTRWRVWDWKEKRHRYPLDEWMGVDRDRATLNLRKRIVEAAVQRPYRQATKEIEQWTGVRRSAMANWKLVQSIAQGEALKETPAPDWHLKPLPRLDPKIKEDPCPILAIDPDGTYCHNQDKEGKDHDVKMAVFYTGKEPESGSEKKWRLINKQVLFSRSDEDVEAFFNRVTHKAMSHYGAHLGTRVIIHGDGDPWIKGLKTDYWDRALIRLDPWHVKKKIRIATGEKEIPKAWEESIYGNPDLLVNQLQLWKIQRTAPHSERRQKMEDLIGYIKNNREGLLPSGVSRENKEKYPRMFKRGSGTIESNIGKGIADRFKQRRMSWSAGGLDNLLYLREKFLNGYPKPAFKVPKPITRKEAKIESQSLH